MRRPGPPSTPSRPRRDVEEFSSARAKAMIEASPLLSEQIGDLDNSLLKQFRNGSTIYYRGTFTQRAGHQRAGRHSLPR